MEPSLDPSAGRGAGGAEGGSCGSSGRPETEPRGIMDLPSVLACEVFPPMASLAKKMIAHNGLQSQIKVAFLFLPKTLVIFLVQHQNIDLTSLLEVKVNPEKKNKFMA